MRKHCILSFLTAFIVVIAMSGTAMALSFPQKEGSCVYNGETITSNFDAAGPDVSQSHLEPGDEVDYVVTYTNNTKETTEWYMINEVLETLEKNNNQAENGGYTYLLQNVGPDGTVTTLFSNEKTVGGTNENEKGYTIPEGLKQATNATGEYFFIQELKPYQSGKTILHVTFDGESEVNDYMDTQGALMVKYAVEKKAPGSKTKIIYSHTKTGDPMNLLLIIALMSAALLIAILAILSWKRERREEGDEA